MAAPEPVALGPAPDGAAPVVPLGVGILPGGGASMTPTAGAIAGATATYPDLYAFAHYLAGGGISTRNRGQRRHTATAHGIEDGARRRKD